MSSCCDSSHEPETTSTEDKETKPSGRLNKFLWKIGKADAEKKKTQTSGEKGCC